MAAGDVSIHTFMPPHLQLLRHKTMNNQGIHTIYPHGDFDAPQYGVFYPFNYFCARVFAYVVAFSGAEFAFYIGKGVALVKINDFKPQAYMAGDGGYAYWKSVDINFYKGMHFSFALRAVYDASGPAVSECPQ